MAAYLQPETLDEAIGHLGDPGLRIAAGCTDLFAATDRQVLAGPVLDLTRVAELRGVTTAGDEAGGGWRIGAATTWTDIVRAELPPAFDMLKQAAREVGSIQIQNAGTVAGNLCNASPAADGVPPLLALDAVVEIAGPDGRREMPLADFIVGPRLTALRAAEMVTALRIPAAAGAGHSGFSKLGARRYLVISIAMVAARIELAEGRIARAAIAVGACSPVARRLATLEDALRDCPLSDLPGAVTPDRVGADLAPIDDVRATAAYRVEVASEIVARLLADITETRP